MRGQPRNEGESDSRCTIPRNELVERIRVRTRSRVRLASETFHAVSSLRHRILFSSCDYPDWSSPLIPAQSASCTMLSHSISSRLKRYVDPNAPKSASRASARPVLNSTDSLAGPPYPPASTSGSNPQQQDPGAPLRFSEKLLPPGAAAPPPPPSDYAAANVEYEEIQRAVAQSREEQEVC